MTLLQYVPFGSNLEPAFWHNLTQLKLNEWKLETASQTVHGFYSNTSCIEGIAPPFRLDFSAFSSAFRIPPYSFLSHGILKNLNTLDEFKNEDKIKFLTENAVEVWRTIVDGDIFDDLSRLNRFVALTFADLKKYDYYYWFGFPAFAEPKEVVVRETPSALGDVFSAEQQDTLRDAVDAFLDENANAAFFVLQVFVNGDGSMKIYKLTKEFASLVASGGPGSQFYLCFSDPSNFDAHPGWPLRNLLTLYSFHFAESRPNVDFICYRDIRKDGLRNINRSLVMKLKVPPLPDNGGIPLMPPVVGWEKNERGKLSPRVVNLSDSMNPRRVAESAVDLNLKLMRWRLVPELDLDTIVQTKVLILGSGTLGCNVARGLLGWGVRHITFLDNGKVSFSNPVRQSLFTFNDCLDGGKPKARAAADSLRLIFPGVITESVEVSIPMPGHSVSSKVSKQVMEDVRKLDQLISDHDVVFLLMDTRESRWLPTIMANAKGKLVMNAALGFDSYVVMRHGVKRTLPNTPEIATEKEEGATNAFMKKIPGNRLGCYYCNDVVAPGDSTKDRTLDQQCTVTRPGVSMIASALVVELLVSILQHPLRGCASAQTSPSDEDDDSSVEAQSCLGIVPHQIRGFLSRHQQVIPSSFAFDKCTGCSDIVIRSFLGLTDDQFHEHKRRIDADDADYHPQFSEEFLLKVFNEPNFLEDITGLTELHQETHNAEIWELSDDDEP